MVYDRVGRFHNEPGMAAKTMEYEKEMRQSLALLCEAIADNKLRQIEYANVMDLRELHAARDRALAAARHHREFLRPRYWRDRARALL